MPNRVARSNANAASVLSSGPWAQGRNRSRNTASKSVSGTCGYPNLRNAGTKSASLACPGRGQTDSPLIARRCQSNRGPGSLLRIGVISECAITRCAGMVHRAMISASKVSSAAICGSGKGWVPVLANSMPMDAEFTSVIPAHSPAPACHARADSFTKASVWPVSETSQCADTSAVGSQSRARASRHVDIAV